jgi:hypothetical protein
MEAGTLISLAVAVVVINGGVIGMLWRNINKKQSKDTCAEVVKRIDQSAKERHEEMKQHLADIKDLIRNNGRQRPKVQT